MSLVMPDWDYNFTVVPTFRALHPRGSVRHANISFFPTDFVFFDSCDGPHQKAGTANGYVI